MILRQVSLIIVLMLVILGGTIAQEAIQLDQLKEAPGPNYFPLTEDGTLWPIPGIQVYQKFKDHHFIDSIYFLAPDSLCISLNGDSIPPVCAYLPMGGGSMLDSTYYFIITVNGSTPDTIISGETVNYVEGTNIDITQGGTDILFNVPNMRDTCRHSLVQVSDSTAALLDCLGDTMGIVTFSGVAELSDTCLQHLYALPDSSNRLVLTDCEGNPMDTVDFFGGLGGADTYADSASVWRNDTIQVYRVDTSGSVIDSFPLVIPADSIDTYAYRGTFAGDTLTVFRQRAGVEIDSFKVEILIDSDTDIDSMQLIGNTLHLWEDEVHLTVDLGQFMDDEPQSFSIDTTTALFTLSDDPTATPDLLVLPWKDSDANDYSANYFDKIRHEGLVGIRRAPKWMLDIRSDGLGGELDGIRIARDSLGLASILYEDSSSANKGYWRQGMISNAFLLQQKDASFGVGGRIVMQVDSGASERSLRLIGPGEGFGVQMQDYGQGNYLANKVLYVTAWGNGGKLLEMTFPQLVDSLGDAGMTTSVTGLNALHNISPDTLYWGGQLLEDTRIRGNEDAIGLNEFSVYFDTLKNYQITASTLIDYQKLRDTAFSNTIGSIILNDSLSSSTFADFDVDASGRFLIDSIGINMSWGDTLSYNSKSELYMIDSGIHINPEQQVQDLLVDSLHILSSIDSFGRAQWKSAKALGLLDYDFILLDGDTAMTLVDTLLPRDSADLHKLIWHGGRVRLGQEGYEHTIYRNALGDYLNFVLDQDSTDTGLQIYGRRSAIDIYHHTRPYIHFRNQFGEFYHRVFDPSAEGPLEPQRYEIGAVGKYDIGDEENFDTTDRAIFTIMNNADAYSLNITNNYLQSDIYTSNRPTDTTDVNGIIGVDSTGRFIKLKLDELGGIIDNYDFAHGSVIWWDTTGAVERFQEDSMMFFWSKDSARLAIGHKIPDTRLHVQENTNLRPTIATFENTSIGHAFIKLKTQNTEWFLENWNTADIFRIAKSGLVAFEADADATLGITLHPNNSWTWHAYGLGNFEYPNPVGQDESPILQAAYVAGWDANGNVREISFDSLNALLDVAVSTPDVTYHELRGDTLGLNLNASVDTAWADLSKYVISIVGDSIYQGGEGILLPAGADSLGRNGTAGRVVLETNTKAPQSTANLLFDTGTNRLGVNTSTPAQSLHVQGTARITGSDGTATTVIGRNASGDISTVSLGSNLSITSGTLNAAADSVGTSGTSGELLFRTGNRGADSDPLLFWNNTSKFLGVGVSPLRAFHLKSAQAVMFRMESTNALGAYLRIHDSSVGEAEGAEIRGTTTAAMYGTSSASIPVQLFTAGVAKLSIAAGTGGAIQFNGYNSANNVGTPTYLLGTDASGNVVKQITTTYDNFGSFTIAANTGTANPIFSGETLTVAGSGISSSNVVGNTVTVNTTIPVGHVTSAMILDATVANGDIANNAITTGKIADGTIVEADLNITNGPTGLHDYILTFNEPGGNFTWVAPSSISADNSTTNELQALSHSTPGADIHTITLSLSGGTSTLTAGTNVTFTNEGTNNLTINAAGGGGGGGTVTSVAAGNGLNFTTITGSGNVTLGTPSSVTLASTNSVSATSHTHAFAPGGTTAQYIRGDGSLATLPSGSADQLGTAFTSGQLIVGNGATSGTSFSTLRYTSDILRVGGTHNGISGHTPLTTIVADNNDIRALQMQNSSAGNAAEFRALLRSNDGSYITLSSPSSGNTASWFGMTRSTGHFLVNIDRAMGIGTFHSQNLVLGTANTARMTISGAGAVDIHSDAVIGASAANQITHTTGATTSSLGSESCTGCSIGFTNSSNRVDLGANSGDIRFTAASNIETQAKFSIGSLYPSGAPTHILDVVGTAGLSTGTLWTNTSDRRIKRDIEDIENPYEKILALNPVSFHYTDDWNEHKKMEDRVRYGYIAQEYQKVFPEDVSMMDEGNEWKGDRLLELSPESVVPHLVAANQQLIRDNEQQAAQISVLTEQINKLYQIINKK